MNGNITFTMIKPNAVKKQYAGKIIDMIVQAGFKIRAMRYTTLSIEEAKEFYRIHEGKPFYSALTEFMSSGPIFVAVLEKENAVESYREFIGSTNPDDASEGTVRQMYGESIQMNAVHGSDSDDNARLEAGFFFSRRKWFR